MKYCIERDSEFYGGFVDGRPVWLEKRRPETRFEGDVAEKILQQLTALGITGCELKLYQGRESKRRAPEVQR